MQEGRLKKALSAIVVSLIVSIPFIISPLATASPEQDIAMAYAALQQKAASEGSVRLIVKLAVPQIQELTAVANSYCSPDPGKEASWGGIQADMALSDAIAFAAQSALLELRGNVYEVKHIYKSIPYMALQVSPEALTILSSSPNVLNIEEDVPYKLVDPVEDSGQAQGEEGSAAKEDPDPPLLNNTVNIIGASTAWTMGYTGSGRYVAILDTGIRSTHQFFSGKTIVEACYASGSDGAGPVGDCPNGLISQTGAGSAVHYASTYQGYDHGTHVAGIAAGNYGTLYGVAKDANIIAVKIFSMFPAGANCGTSPCVLSWNSDCLAGLDYVYSIRGTYSIPAVNMSIGGGSYASACDTDARKAVIDNLRTAGIATVISTGNSSYCGSISAPACISTSVATGSTTDADVRSSFSNWHATMQKLFAPGSSINSSTGGSDSSYQSWSGTSMAAPHVTGAWALVKHFNPTATVTEILAALQATGVPITACSGSAIPRIKVDLAINSMLPQTITLTSPNGGENWNSGTSHNITWTSTGSFANVMIDYSINNGSAWTPVIASTPNNGSYAWTVPATLSPNCLVRVSDTDSEPTDVSNRIFSISSSATETISTPILPAGPASGFNAVSYQYATGGSASNLGDSVQYLIDWNDGSDSGWLAVGTTTASHSWATPGTYGVKAKARCATHTTIESSWSGTFTVFIADSGAAGKYNAPGQYKVLPEVIWASATGGGTWMSNVQVTDVSGGSVVSVYYNTGTTRRGPFQLWSNSAGSALSSAKYTNLLETIDGLDSGTFTYYGTVGAVEFFTQDSSHKIQAASRTLNGNYAKTFTALSLHDANTAASGRMMIIPNLTNNASYRSSSGFFNPSEASLTMEVKLFNASNVQVGTTVTRTLAGHEFQAFNPFIQAGIPYPGTTSDNIILEVTVTAGSGKVVCFGATVNNTSNDPAGHVALQAASSYDNGPGSQETLPEAIWASATGGGTWMTEVQLADVTGGSVVSVYFDYGGGSRRGPFTLWTGGAAGSMIKYANMLETIDGLDSGVFTYYGKVGSVVFQTQDGAHLIGITARTLNGDYSKTFPGLKVVDAETASTSRVMLIQNYSNNVGYRSTSGFYNPTANSVTVEFTLLNSSGVQIGSQFSKAFAGYDFQAFNPFIQAGVPYPGSSYDNVILRIRPTAGTGQVIGFGASVDNTSNDPASHLAVQGQ